MMKYSSFSDSVLPDQEGINFANWQTPNTTARMPVKPAPDIGVLVERGGDLDFFAPGFGTASNAIAETSLKNTGKYFSKAYNLQDRVSKFMGNEFNPNSVHADLSGVYHRFKEYVASKGFKEEFEIKGFGSGFTRDRAMAMVVGKKYLLMNKKSSSMMHNEAKRYGVSYDAVELHTLLHEFCHLMGVAGDPESEQTVEELVNGFSAEMIEEIYNSSRSNNRTRVELASLIREVKEIARDREEKAYDLYSKVQSGKKSKEEDAECLDDELEEKNNEEDKGIEYIANEDVEEGEANDEATIGENEGEGEGGEASD